MARHASTIDWPHVAAMASGGDTIATIAAELDVGVNTLTRRCKQDNGCTVAALGRSHSGADPAVVENSGQDLPLTDSRHRLLWDNIGAAIQDGATDEEIFTVTGRSPSSLDTACKKKHKRSWADWAGKHRAILTMRVRRIQLQAANAGNVSMMKLTGEELIGQGEGLGVESNVIGWDWVQVPSGSTTEYVDSMLDAASRLSKVTVEGKVR